MSVKMVQQPKDLNIKLHDNQLINIYNMEQLELNQIVSNDKYIRKRFY